MAIEGAEEHEKGLVELRNGHSFEPGTCYCFHTPETEASIYHELAKMGEGNVIYSRAHPRKLSKEYGLKPESLNWISTTEDKDFPTFHPSDIAKINMKVCGTDQRIKPGIRHVHFGRGTVNYLINFNGLPNALTFMAALSDRTAVGGCVLTADVDIKSFKAENDYENFVKNCKFVEMDPVQKSGTSESQKARSLANFKS